MKLTIIIDRPIGFNHKGIIYSVNYGYVPNIIGGDGQEQDVYVLDKAIDYPISEYIGEIIAVIEREDDIETKWIVSNEKWSIAEIREKVNFIEQYFCSHIYLIEEYALDKVEKIKELICKEEV